MNLRHATALALVGWLLMVSPDGWRIFGGDDFRIFNTFRAAMSGRSNKR